MADIFGPTNQDFSFGGVVKSIANRFKKPVPAGAMPDQPVAVTANFKSATGDSIEADNRVKIRIPRIDYFGKIFTDGPYSSLLDLGGIIFPYTPTISYEQKADYASAAPMHSNYAIYFYQRSSVSPITIAGKFTVQNERDAGNYLATLHLLRALTKMKFGGSTGDKDSGSPPPVCRLDAYGDFMLKNVPVVISSFRIELPENVDYYTTGKRSDQTYEKTTVPVISTITVTCIPVYSRAEMQSFSVTGWLGNPNVRKAGYL